MLRGLARRICPAGLVAAALVAAEPASYAQSSNLMANPVLMRDLPPPGWIGDHPEEWVQQHPVFASRCATPEVVTEARFLNRVIAYDEYLLSLTVTPGAGNAAAAKLAELVSQTMPSLRRDVTTADALVAQLRLLPPCDEARPQPTAASLPPQPTPTTKPPPAAPASPPAAQPAPVTPAVAAPAPTPPSSDRAAIRFDDKVPALTPYGIRVFDWAVESLRSGRKIELAIDGCGADADFSDGSACARRLRSLKRMLAENGIRDVKNLLPGLP